MVLWCEWLHASCRLLRRVDYRDFIVWRCKGKDFVLTVYDLSPLPPYAYIGLQLHMAVCCCLRIPYYIVCRSIPVSLILVSSQNTECMEEQRNNSQFFVQEKKQGFEFYFLVFRSLEILLCSEQAKWLSLIQTNRDRKLCIVYVLLLLSKTDDCLKTWDTFYYFFFCLLSSSITVKI